MNDPKTGGNPLEHDADRRNAPRKRAVIGAILANRSGGKTWDCRIRNLSESGAQIVLGDAQFVPEDCVLINLKDAVAYEAIVEWRHPPMLGIKLLRTHNLQGEIEPNLTFARRLWLARRGLRDGME